MNVVHTTAHHTTFGKKKSLFLIYPSSHSYSYKRGGVASGMKQVETNTYDIRRLLHVKGKKNVVAGEVRDSRPVTKCTHTKLFIEGKHQMLRQTEGDKLRASDANWFISTSFAEL